jgi:D-glycero-alpha-D-manno-heptose-7-phosphate kinase
MFISVAPTRICLIGGGTDVNPYAAKYQGALINVAVDLTHKVTITPRKDNKILVSAMDEKRKMKLGEKLVYGQDKKFDVIRAIINYFYHKIPSGFNLNINSAVKDSCGLGTSGSVEVALIGCFKKWLNEKIDKNNIAQLAYDLESKELGWNTGKQDQWAAAYGGLNLMLFGKGEKVSVNPIKLSNNFLTRLQDWLVLYYTGGQRLSSDIQSSLKAGMSESEKIKAFNKLKQITFKAAEVIKNGDLKALGKLFDIGWQTKKKTNPLVTNKRLDKIYDIAKKSGIYGGKLIGAGGAGYYFFLCPPKQQQKLDKNLRQKKTYKQNFSFDFIGLR